jgi:hypothetical protein
MAPGKFKYKMLHFYFGLSGLFALLWVLLRSGTNPKRLAYPCQQASIPIALNWLLSVAAFLTGSIFIKKFTKFAFPAAVFIGVLWFSFSTTEPSMSFVNPPPPPLPVWEVPNPVSKVFVMDSVPTTSGSLAAGDSTVPNSYLPDPAIDTLLMMMSAKNIPFYKTPSAPNGIVGSNNVVVIKGNFQWTSRNTTSTDRIKGVIWRVLQHPDGFTGEIMVCDNTQDIGTGINDNDNNSEDPQQSIIDVVNTFHSKGYPVHCLDWNTMWDDVANEYSQGDYNNGYVYESSSKITYPKFRTPMNRYVSLRYGIWDSALAVYDSSKLCIIDFPVLKAHGMAGATIAVKNWIGVLTTAYSSERFGGWSPMHTNYFFSTYALVARVMEAAFPRLSIVDADWTSRTGPNNLQYVQHTSMLAASTDPAAVSWYTAKFILTPIALNPGQTNPDLPGSAYRNCLTNWTSYLRTTAGLPCTKDSSEISVYGRNILIGVNNKTENAAQYKLYQNHPNPFNSSTLIKFQIFKTGPVKIVILDVSGKELVTLVDTTYGKGLYEVKWNAENYSSGVYFYKLTAGNISEVKKMVLVK